METTREEDWGRIVYDRQRDEFFAEAGSPGASIDISRPISAGCLLTPSCNLRCEFCYGNFEALPAATMPAKDWERLFIHMHRDWGLMRVDLSGGEPTLRKDCALIAQAASNAGLNVVLSTNGTVLHRKGMAGFPPDIRVHVSIDSGFQAIHEGSRLLPTFGPSRDSFYKVSCFIRRAIDDGFRVRVLTCVGPHNASGLFALAEHLTDLGVPEWNISHVLSAGRAQQDFESTWALESDDVAGQVDTIRGAFPWIVVRYSDRTKQAGYFLLVLNDGSLATQFTDGRDKVRLGWALETSLSDLRVSREFNISEHAKKWIAAEVEPQSAFVFN